MEIQIQKTDSGELVVDSETVAKGFDIDHRSLCMHVQEHFTHCQYVNMTDGEKGRPKKVYLLTERQIMILPVYVKPTPKVIAFQEALVDAFLEARALIQNESLHIPADLLGLSEAMHRQMGLLLDQIKRDKPKVDFYNAMSTSPDNISIGAYAKSIGWGPNKLFARLRREGLLFKKDGNNVPYERFINAGYFDVHTVVKQVKETQKIFYQTVITPKGQEYIMKRLRNEMPKLGENQYNPIKEITE